MRRIRASLIIGILLVAYSITPIQAATRSGDVCKKIGITAISNGKKYTCIKSGKKLIWNKGVRESTATDKAATDKAAQEKLASDIAAAQKQEAEKLAEEKAAAKEAEEKLAAEQAAAAKLAAEQAASAKLAAANASAHRAKLIPCPADGKCLIGNIGPGGGIVFYVATTPQSWGQYLEAAPASWSGSFVDPYTQWCSLGDTILAQVLSSTEMVKINSMAIGAGKSNTQLMLSSCMNGIATAVTNYRGGGKSDWFVPSADETTEMFKTSSLIGDLSISSYWSSTLAPVYGAWQQILPVEINYTSDETNASSVRPVRAFF